MVDTQKRSTGSKGKMCRCTATVLKSEEATLKKQIVSLNAQFQELMISVAELYPDVLTRGFAKGTLGFVKKSEGFGEPSPQCSTPPIERRSSERPYVKQRPLSYRFSPESLRDGKGSLLSEWKGRVSKSEKNETNKTAEYVPRVSKEQKVTRRKFSPNPSTPEHVPSTTEQVSSTTEHVPSTAEHVQGAVSAQCSLIEDTWITFEDSKSIFSREKRNGSDKGVPGGAVDIRATQRQSIAKVPPSTEGMSIEDSERRRRIKERLKESRKKLDVIQLGLF
ncbi:uncharacterized protein LOC116601994 isoform X1 [Nematostella vectensis]|uniref:uncharacterized protein LOC116601994 isoform X1 n=1 Tax=Nematostella vectensis TaxID=45351 RepID=UPI00207747ED|nr:uncharacterized protein LOC116601994 isoform X1 [Nematostella vectensis]